MKADSEIQEALERFALAQEAEAEERAEQLDDLRFRALQQWPEKLKNMRERDINGARPCLVLDQVGQRCRQVINDTRQNLPSIRVRPVDNRSDKDTAQVINGLIRHVEDVSSANMAYLTALDWSVTCGLGYFRILTQYTTDDSWDQEIRIERIHNRFAVYRDPYSTSLDGSDLEWVFITDDVPWKALKTSNPKAEIPSDFPSGSEGDLVRGWFAEETVRIAEYFKIVREKDEVVLLEDQSSMYGSRYEELLSEGADLPRVIKPRPVERRKCRWQKISGCEVLEEAEFPSTFIPVIPVMGTEFWIEGKRQLSGLVRPAKDPQRGLNYHAPMDLDTPLPTPTGWTTMRHVRKGDVLFDDKGIPCNVLGTSPVYSGRECFRVEFDDGTDIIADSEHLWTVEERIGSIGNRPVWATKTLPTAQLRPKDHFIYATRPLDLPAASLPVDPYYLGAWLGDGTSRASSITSSAADVDEMRLILEECGLEVGNKRKSNSAYIFTIHGVVGQLADLGLIGPKLGRRGERRPHKAIAKHIPEAYLRASFQQRLALLQGLMDTDGSINKATGQCSFTTAVAELRDGFAELLRSLGIKVVVVEVQPSLRKFPSGRTYKCAVYWRFSFSPRRGMEIFRLSRKAAVKKQVYHDRRTSRFCIKSVKPVASVPVKCVSVDSESHLFLVGISMVPTHNSVATEIMALQPRAPYIGAEGQFEGHPEWDSANSENYSKLEYNPVSLNGVAVGAPQRQQLSGAPSGMLQMMQMFAGQISMATGMHEASFGAPSNETSGIAIRERKEKGDVGTAHFRGNLGFSMLHAGRILLEMFPRVMDTAQIARIIGEDGAIDTVSLDPQLEGAFEKTPKGEPNLHNITIGRYDVSIDIGPAFATRRQDAAAAMIEMARVDQALMPTAGDLVYRQMDWPGSEQLADRRKKGLPPEFQDDEGAEGQIPPQMKAQIDKTMQQYEGQLAQAQQMIEGLQQQLGEASQAAEEGQAAAKDKGADHALKSQEIEVKRFEAHTKRMEAEAKAMETQARAQVEAERGPAAPRDTGADDVLKSKEMELKAFEMETTRLELQIKAHETQSRIDQIQADTAQVEGVNETLAGLIQAQQGIQVALGELTQIRVEQIAAEAQQAEVNEAIGSLLEAMQAPKTIELVRDEQGRAASAVVSQGKQSPTQIELLHDPSGRLAGAHSNQRATLPK